MALAAILLTFLVAVDPAAAHAANDPAPADTGTVDAAARFEAARRNRDLRGGNFVAVEIRETELKRYGADSALRVPGLYEIARWYVWADRPSRERATLNEAVEILERSYGLRDSRLAYPLRAIASSCVRGRSKAGVARAALDRALKLEYASTRADLLERAEVFAVRGDVEAVFDTPAAGTGWYRAAWRRLADSKLAGPEAANEFFGQPAPIYVNVPDKPFTSRKGDFEHFAAGTVAFGFTVSAEGVIEQLRLRESVAPIESLPGPAIAAFRQARYRPRVVAGEPVATPEHGFVLNFSRDEQLAKRRASFGQLDQAR